MGMFDRKHSKERQDVADAMSKLRDHGKSIPSRRSGGEDRKFNELNGKVIDAERRLRDAKKKGR